ncbi:MAG: hypothetical protein R3C68_02225 [Myxococcota bacterium]
MAVACGEDTEEHRRLFRLCAARLEQTVAENSPSEERNLGGLLTQVSRGLLPVLYEFVLVYRGTTPTGYGFLSQGSTAASLPESLENLLRTGLELYLGAAGTMSQAQRLADMFAVAFDDRPALKRLSPTAMAFILGIVPKARGMALKAYFNTRISPGDNRLRVLRMLERGAVARADAERVYDAIHHDQGPTRFAGVGIDLTGSDRCRLKLYVRINTEDVVTHLDTVSRALDLPHDAAKELKEHMQQLPCEHLASEHEIAVALASGCSPTLKATLFLSPKAAASAAKDVVVKVLEDHGCCADPFVEVFSNLVDPQIHAHQPIHAIGYEAPKSCAPKINLYMKPTV